MTPTPPAERAGEPRPVQTTVDLTGLHRKALEALQRELLPGQVVRVVILGEPANTPASAPVPAPSPAQELHHLAELRDLGVITPEEFEIMKARIVHEH